MTVQPHLVRALNWKLFRHPSSNNAIISFVTETQGSRGESSGTDESVFRQVPVPGNGHLI